MTRMKGRFIVVALAAALAAAPAGAKDYAQGAIRVEHPSTRPTPPGARTGGVYFTLHNTGGEPDRLLRVASPAAEAAELHSMTMDGNVMRMRAVRAIDVPARSSVALASGGYHVMLIGLRHPIAVGAGVPLTLTFERAGSIEVVADVEAAAAAGHDAPHGASHGTPSR
jgi:copper(I)-binding protein